MNDRCGLTSDIISDLLDNVIEKNIDAFANRGCSEDNCPLVEHLVLGNSTSVGYLDITAPNLKLLFCEGLFSSICFKNTPQLAKVTICLNDGMNGKVFSEGESSKVVFFDSLTVVEVLELDYYYAKFVAVGGVPKSLPTTLSRLTIVTLYGICFWDLDEAHTHKTAAVVDPILELLKVLDWVDVSLYQLREVEMKYMFGTSSELDFVKLLLAKSPAAVLETMHIEQNSANVVDGGLSILKEVTRFRRLSPQAGIKFENLVKGQV
ncbi:hypothetical protein ACSBR2_006430 [Camellia fascicularis]